MALRFLNSGYFAGKVGIGTDSPDAQLDIGVNNIITLDDTGSSTGFIGLGSYNNGTINRAQGASYYGFGLEIDRPNELISFKSYDSSGATNSGVGILTLKRDGNVGLGTNSPGSLLEIKKGVQGGLTLPLTINPGFYQAGTSSGIGFLTDGNTSYTKGALVYTTNGTGWNIGDFQFLLRNDGNQNLVTLADAKMTIKASGKVGIGTTDPNQKLSVKGVINSDANDDYYGVWLSGNSDGTANNYIGLGAWYSTAGYLSYVHNNRLKLYTYDDDEHVTLQEAGGFVGIGTAAPRGLLEIGSGGSLGAVTNKKISAIIDGGYSTTNSLQYNVTSFIGTTLTEPSTDIFDQTGSETDKNFYTGLISSNSYFNGSRYSVVQGGAERLTIARGGNVGIGRTTPSSKLQVVGVVTIDGSGTGTSGSVAIQDNYSGTNHLGNIGWNRSAGGPYLAYGIKQDGSADWKSTFDNFSGMRSYMKLDNNEMQLAWAPAQQTTVDTAITGLLERFTFQLDNGTLKLNAYDSTNKTGTPTYLLGTDASGNVVKTNTVPGSAAGPYLPLTGGTITGNVKFNDGNQLFLGNDNDLQIYHDGTDSYVSNTQNSGNLIIQNGGNDKDVIFKCDDGSGGLAAYLTLDGSITKMIASKDIHFDGAVKATFGSNATPASIYYNGNGDVDTGAGTVANVAIATYTAAFFDFVIKKTTNVRSGTVYACHDGTNVEFTETSTQDLGDTSDVTLSVDISGGNMRLLATVTSDNWSVKSLIRAI